MDGAHIAKKVETAVHITLKWLDAGFVIMQSATPVINHHRDYLGFLSLIEKPGLWNPANLARLDITKDVNPYADSLDDKEEDEEIQPLRCTTAAFRKFIIETSNPKIAGYRLRKVFARSMLRRTYQSRIPFNTGPMIGEIIPPIYSTMIDTAFTAKGQFGWEPIL